MSSTLKEYRKQAKAEAIEKRSQSGQLQPHPAPSPPVSEYHSTASVDGETEIGDSASQVNQDLNFIVSHVRKNLVDDPGPQDGFDVPVCYHKLMF